MNLRLFFVLLVYSFAGAIFAGEYFQFIPRKDGNISRANPICNIDEKICVSNARTSKDRKALTKKDCFQPKADKITKNIYMTLEKVYEFAPVAMKVYLCSVNRISVDYRLRWNASSNEPKNTIAIRKSLFERSKSFNYLTWMSSWSQFWFLDIPESIDRNNSGDAVDGIFRHYYSKSLPHISETNLTNIQAIPDEVRGIWPIVFQLVAHEIGHISEYQYNLVPYFRRSYLKDCPSCKLGSDFEGLSWKGNFPMIPPFKIGGDKQSFIPIKFNSNDLGWSPTAKSLAGPIFASLNESAFVTLFAVREGNGPDGQRDDWAESLAFVWLYDAIDKNFAMKPFAKMLLKNGRSYDLFEKLNEGESSAFQVKRQFIEAWQNYHLNSITK